MSRALSGGATIAALLLALPAPAQAQESDSWSTDVKDAAGEVSAAKDLVFAVELPEEAGRAVTDPDNMSPPQVAARLARSAKVVYRGERPAKARFLALFVTADGEVVAGVASDAVALEPGTRDARRYFPDSIFDERRFPDSTFDGRRFPDTIFGVRAFPDGYFDEVRFPDSTFDPRRFPDSAFDPRRFPDSAFEGLRLREGESAIILALVPADPDVFERSSVRPAGAALQGEQ